jgi:hypothetical protein
MLVSPSPAQPTVPGTKAARTTPDSSCSSPPPWWLSARGLTAADYATVDDLASRCISYRKR